MAAVPRPVAPDYSGASVQSLAPALLAPRPVLPAWFPPPAHGAQRHVLLVLDGLGWDQLSERAHVAPTLSSMASSVLTSVAPSTTATALTSITTGLTPGEHGIVGYRIDLGGDVVNMLSWRDAKGDVRRVHEPQVVQPFAPFLGEDVTVVTKAEFDKTAFTAAHLRGGRACGWRVPSAIPVIIAERVAVGDRFVYAYYDGVDKVAHERGFGPHYDAELRYADRLVADVLAALPADVCLLVTADHGQVQVDAPVIVLSDEVARHVRLMSGEGRFRWLHAVPGQQGSLLAAATARYSDVAWVRSRQQVIDDGWLGPVVSAPVAARLGDVALVPFADVAFDDPSDRGAFPLRCRHGSLTAAEMLVPLLAARGTMP
jgi:hypothetical protein